MNMEEWLKGLVPILIGLILGTLLAHGVVAVFFSFIS